MVQKMEKKHAREMKRCMVESVADKQVAKDKAIKLSKEVAQHTAPQTCFLNNPELDMHKSYGRHYRRDTGGSLRIR